jgi:hypothetical protein
MTFPPFEQLKLEDDINPFRTREVYGDSNIFPETEIYNIMVTSGGIVGPVDAVLRSEVPRFERIGHLTTLLS